MKPLKGNLARIMTCRSFSENEYFDLIDKNYR